MLTTSDVLGGRYRLDGPVAAGGMGEVWRATDTVLGRTVAVKVMRAVPDFAARFRAEARTLATMHHPGVVEVYDYGEVGGEAYLVMAYVHGEPLSHRIAAAGGRLGPAETMGIVAQIAHALAAAHAAGVVHRDVKPDNLLITEDGRVVLVDFGIAHAEGEAALTGAREVIGTARYMAPEQVTKGPASPATDVYALGAVAYECLAGRPPFRAATPLAYALAHLSEEPEPLPADVPPAVRAVVTTAMAKDPARRYPSAEAMASAAEAAQAAGPRSTLQFAALPPEAGAAGLAGAVGVAAPVIPPPPRHYEDPTGYLGSDEYASQVRYPDSGGRGRYLALLAALIVIALGIAAVLYALSDRGSGGAPVGPTTGVSRSSGPSRHPSTSARASTSSSTQPSASTTPTTSRPSPSPTPTTAPPTTVPPTTAPPTTTLPTTTLPTTAPAVTGSSG